MRKEIIEYDIVRAVTMLLVILGHCTYTKIMTDYGGMALPIPDNVSLTEKGLCFVSRCIYGFHMPLFMALSGCLWAVTLKRKGLQDFVSLVKSKARRLLLPFISVAVLWSIPIKYISGYWSGHINDVLSHIFIGQILMYGNSNSHLWFLQALFLVFVLSYVIERWLPRRNVVLFFVVLLAASIIGRYLERGNMRLLNIQSALMYLVWFYCGFYFEGIRERYNNKVRSTSIFTILILSALYPVMILAIENIPDFLGKGTIAYYGVALAGMFLTYAICLKTCSHFPPPLLIYSKC